jgi:4-alpha-glucanotransferase/alpha-amylase
VDETAPALAFRAAVAGGKVSKQYRLTGARLAVTYAFEGLAAGTFATELNLSLPACDGFSGRYILANGEIPCGFGQHLARDGLTMITLDDRELGGALVLAASVPLALNAQPHFTVSQSEAGFEKIMQAATISLALPLTPELTTLTVTIEIVVRPDAAPPRQACHDRENDAQ